MSSFRRAVSGAAGRVLGRPRDRHEGYSFCTRDGYWFRPPYTEGKCPLCGEVAPGGGPPPPLVARIDRSSLGLAAFALVSLAMSALVLLIYVEA
jgi:hypothetical protein